MRVKFKPDAAALWWRSLPGFSNPRWSPSRHENLYYRTLQVLQGAELPAVEGVVSGTAGCVYVLTPQLPAPWAAQARQMAVPNDLVACTVEGPGVPPVVVGEAAGAAAHWAAAGLRIVRLLTPWVDGFMAFTPMPAEAPCTPA